MRPQALDVAVGQPAREIADAIHAHARLPRMVDEFFRGEIGSAEVAARDAGARDAQLARHADRAQAIAPIEDE